MNTTARHFSQSCKVYEEVLGTLASLYATIGTTTNNESPVTDNDHLRYLKSLK